MGLQTPQGAASALSLLHELITVAWEQELDWGVHIQPLRPSWERLTR